MYSRCPNPADGTVELIQNGISTAARFSFRMFTFTNFSTIYLHCQVHLCLLRNNNCSAVSWTMFVCVFWQDWRDYQQTLGKKPLMLFFYSIVTQATSGELRGMYPPTTPLRTSRWDH